MSGKLSKEPLKVIVRVRPISDQEMEAGKHQGCVEIVDGHDLLLTAPKSSQNYKNFLRGTSKASHKYTFSKIIDPAVKQKEFFEDTTLQTVQDFVNGQNCLVFAYGVTNSGQTYTIQGTKKEPGILPRSLDVLFNSVEAQLDESGRFRPHMFSGVTRLSDQDVARGAKEKREVMMMSADVKNAATNAAKTTVRSAVLGDTSVSAGSDSDRGSLSTTADSSSARPTLPLKMLPEINREIEDMVVDIQGQENVKFSIWVSFAEIYNEFIYDLLDKIPQQKRRVLRLSDDPNGNVFIKGLKKICVKNADEAYRVMLAGQKNLHKAATKLNHNSSRSHRIFTISLVRIVDAPSPEVARTSMVRLVDLAGSERQKKTGCEGERLKENSNINTTLMTLRRCIRAMKYNQTHPANKHQIVPFRESRLTRLFQTFFQGQGRAMMIVNVNQLASTFDETLHAVKFSAIAKEVVILTQPEPPLEEITEKKIMGPPALPPNKNVGKGKASIPAKPAAKPGVGAMDNAKKSTKSAAATTGSALAETTIDLNVTTSSESADGSCRCKDVPTEYYTIDQGNYMKALIESLKDSLEKKSRENRELEMKIWQEVAEEMARIREEADERVAKAQAEKRRTGESGGGAGAHSPSLQDADGPRLAHPPSIPDPPSFNSDDEAAIPLHRDDDDAAAGGDDAAAASGDDAPSVPKRKGRGLGFSKTAVSEMRKVWRLSQRFGRNPTKEEKEECAESLGSAFKRVSGWFANQSKREKRQAKAAAAAAAEAAAEAEADCVRVVRRSARYNKPSSKTPKK